MNIPQALTARELEALLQVTSVGDHRSQVRSRDHLLLHVLAGTGMRISEVLGLHFDDLDPVTRRVWVRPISSKGGKGRYVYISATLRDRIAAWTPPPFYEPFMAADTAAGLPTPLFLTKAGTPVTATHVRGLLKKISRRAGVEPSRVHAHAFRHTYAIRFLDAGGSLSALRDQLGHASISTTAIYTLASSAVRESFTEGLPF